MKELINLTLIYITILSNFFSSIEFCLTKCHALNFNQLRCNKSFNEMFVELM